MKKSLVALATLSMIGSAFAVDIISNETNKVEVYGILDAGVASVQHSLAGSSTFPSTYSPLDAVTKTAVPNSNSGLINGGMQDSRIGFRGTRDLGEGMKAFFTAESGFNLTTGRLNDAGRCLSTGGTSTESCSNSSMMGQLFGRQAFVGLSDEKAGSIQIGRNYNMVYDVFTSYDPAMKSDLFSPLGISGTIGGGGGISENSRIDNSIKYKNKVGDVNFGLLLGAGNQNGVKDAGTGWIAQLGYESGDFGIQVVTQKFEKVLKGAADTATYDNVNVYSVNLESTLVALKYKANDKITLKGGVENYTISNSSTTYTSSSLQNFYGYKTSNVYNMKNGTVETAPVTVTFLGGDWNATPKLNVALGLYNMSYGKSTGAAYNSAAYSINATSVILDYKLDKQTDTYVGLMFTDYSGDKITSSYWSSNSVVGMGVRYKF